MDSQITQALDSSVQEYSANVLDYFKINQDPFGFIIENTESFRQCIGTIKKAPKRQHMLVVIGAEGMGKTTLVKMLEADNDLFVIRPDAAFQKKITQASLCRSMIERLTYNDNEKIPCLPESLFRKLGEKLYERANDPHTGQILLILDDGQQWHKETLLILKRIREVEHRGKGSFFEVIYFTQPEGATRLRRIREVARRCLTFHMSGFTKNETKKYITQALGHLFESEKVINEFCKYCLDTRPLALKNILWKTLERVLVRGGERIEMEDVTSGLSLKELINKLGISLSEIAENAGVSRTVAGLVMNKNYTGKLETVQKTELAAHDLVLKNLKLKKDKSKRFEVEKLSDQKTA